ncbi:MAG TPA: hypothetical protein VEX38_07535, partial [Fimbriimonadaceae bacterium]|nr:hypothetical protein [Fimbriimonadaceae bacterium]
MKLEFNPWSGTNAAGAIIAAVSPCLLALNWETDSWSVWRTPFSIVLTLGIVMMASYRRIEVRPDRSGFEVRSGLWPLVFRTQSTTCVFKAVVLDAYYQRTVQFTAHLEYSGEKIRRVKLLN